VLFAGYSSGACVGSDPDLFWVEGTATATPNVAQVSEAVAICQECRVRSECLAWADANPALAGDGVWGGTTGEQRRHFRTSQLSAV
jgi:hypothetical protein